MTDEQLLAVLDIPTQEGQIKRLIELGYTDLFVQRQCGRDGIVHEARDGSLADLAFRLRDEVKGLRKDCTPHRNHNVWWEGCKTVYLYVTQKPFDGMELRYWWWYEAQLIHYIIAAVIAKEHANET